MKAKRFGIDLFCRINSVCPDRFTKRFKANAKFLTALALATLFIAPVFPPLPLSAKSKGAASSVSHNHSGSIARSSESDLSTLYSPYWYADKRTEATIEIANNSPSSRTLNPVLILRGVEKVVLDHITIPSGGTARVSLNSALKARLNSTRASGDKQRWGDGSRKHSLWGAALLQGASIKGISSWILSENRKESLSINTLFDAGVNRSMILSAMWWRPTTGTTALYALQNTSDSELQVSTLLYLNGGVVHGRSVMLPSGSTRLVDLRELMPDKKSRKQLPDVGMVRFVAPSEVGSLVGQAVIFDEQVGFSVPLAMHNITSKQGNSVQTPGTPLGRPDRSMGFPTGTRFATQLLLTNTSDSAISVTATLDGKNSTGSLVSWNAPVINLAAFESRVINLEKARLESDSPVADGYAAVRLTHTGNMIDLLAEAVTVDQTLSLSFYDPFSDDKLARRLRHAVSFNLNGSRNSLLVLKNTSAESVRYGYTLNYQAGDAVQTYTAELSELAPREVKVIDIESLRDTGAPDGEGRSLPGNLSFGNASVYAERAVLIAGDPSFDPVAGISSSRMDWHTGQDQSRGGISPQHEVPDPICDDPCYFVPTICLLQATICATCCTVCNNAHQNCLLLASGVLAAAIVACSVGVCTSQGSDSPACVACLAAAGAVFALALVICGNTRENCRLLCTNTPNCTCPS